jgi:hypothetical protein
MDDDWISVGENVANSNATFPQKLFIMSLRDFDKGDVLLWLPHGLAFKIVDSDRFSEEIIPRYFKRKSFQTEGSNFHII